MSNSHSQRRVVLALALLTCAIAACDTRATAPAEIRRAATKPSAVEGDTTLCRQGWTIINGRYVCNEDM